MEPKAIESPERDVCDSDLDVNWNERKRLTELEFELRSRIQEALLKADPAFEQLRQEERACKADLARNDQEYEALILRWSEQLASARASA